MAFFPEGRSDEKEGGLRGPLRRQRQQSPNLEGTPDRWVTPNAWSIQLSSGQLRWSAEEAFPFLRPLSADLVRKPSAGLDDALPPNNKRILCHNIFSIASINRLINRNLRRTRQNILSAMATTQGLDPAATALLEMIAFLGGGDLDIFDATPSPPAPRTWNSRITQPATLSTP
jgi:hypothetical protein